MPTKKLVRTISRRRKAGSKKTQKRSQRPISFLAPETGDERVLALDTSSRCVGWSIFDNGELAQHGRYLQVGSGHGEKMATFRLWMLRMLEEFRPTRLIYEAPYRGLNGSVFGLLSKYAGVVEQCHFEYFEAEMPPEDAVPAKVVKRTIGAPKVLRSGRGRKKLTGGDAHAQNKIVVLKMVNERFSLGLKYKGSDEGKAISQDDESDAIALNWAWHLLNRPQAGTEESHAD